MYGTAELQIAAKTDGHVVQTVLQTADGKQIRQGLGGMLVTAVAGIDNRNA